jgi:hypothetical protein
MRTWLKDKYPEGIGLGDLVYEYVTVFENPNNGIRCNRAEATQRAMELKSVLNYLNYTKCTPTFSEDLGTVYLNNKKVNL